MLTETILGLVRVEGAREKGLALSHKLGSDLIEAGRRERRLEGLGLRAQGFGFVENFLTPGLE